MKKKTLKKIEKFNKALNTFVKNKDVVKVSRAINGKETTIEGVLMASSDQFLLIQETDEFLFNGFVLIPMDYVISISSNELDGFYRDIIKKEGLFDKNFKLSINLTLDSWEDIFKALKAEDIHVIAESEEQKEPVFLIGGIEKVSSKDARIHNYDAMGDLDSKATKIKYEEITMLRFLDRYSSTFRKYVEPAKKKAKKEKKAKKTKKKK